MASYPLATKILAVAGAGERVSRHRNIGRASDTACPVPMYGTFALEAKDTGVLCLPR